MDRHILCAVYQMLRPAWNFYLELGILLHLCDQMYILKLNISGNSLPSIVQYVLWNHDMDCCYCVQTQPNPSKTGI